MNNWYPVAYETFNVGFKTPVQKALLASPYYLTHILR